MATGDTVLPLALSSPPPPLLDNSPSNLSSPLSDVEDKYADHEEDDLDIRGGGSSIHGTPQRNGDHTRLDSDPPSSSPGEGSKLSELDINDSEAETERLYDTPPKNGATRDIVNSVDGAVTRRFIDRRERAFERSPSKLHQQLQADIDAEAADNGHNSPSEEEDEEEGDDDDVSMASSDNEPDPEPVKLPQPRPPTTVKKTQVTNSTETNTLRRTSQDSAESRKRKRPSVVGQVESEQPPKKRASIDAVGHDFSADDTPMADDEGLSTTPQSGNQTADEDNIEEPPAATDLKGETLDSGDEDVGVLPRLKKGKRSPAKKRKSKSPEERTPEEAPDEPPETADRQSAVPTPQVEDLQPGEIDEEAEAAHRNEEELERKKAAWDELAAIEKQFSNFREKLYQERLEQLNREEEMLLSDNPTHPEYLAMLQCLEERRAEKIRVSTVELQFKMSVLKHRAVAERAQIMSQYYQAVRESREKTLDLLGQDWYDVQQERRRLTNVIPEFGLHIPANKTQAARQAVSYNREVSILSGFAKHVGFPAAPTINGVSEDQLEDDLEAIENASKLVSRPVPKQPPPFRPELSAGFGPSLDMAGEMFIEQTPWANPNHPSHQLQRQQQGGYREPEVQPTFAGPSSGHPRLPPPITQHPGVGVGYPPAAPLMLNGDSPAQLHKGMPPAGAESLKRSKLPSEPLRHETAIHAS
ncbi:Sds3-like-domain-containing protein [Podospora fimiseda]|uniref:Sds3-like-domain-containing protein n=1 Tax=Podospora fimiseda TaxID=252190 RepID=A0AAN7BT89_9PEZI|nr:Sds3-like-domain-containing protein [Podospora fimiseda]